MRTLLVALLLTGCSLDIRPNPPESPDGCGAACERMRELDCPEGLPTPEQVSCERVCGDVQASGLSRIDTECLVRATSCSEAGEC